MPRRVPWRLVSKHRNYEVAELAAKLGVCRATVGNWIKGGLPAIIDRKPHLISGDDFKRWYPRERANRKQKCRPGEMYCFTCRKPKPPALGMVDFTHRTGAVGTLSAFCQDCERPMFRACHKSRISEAMPGIDVSVHDSSAEIK